MKSKSYQPTVTRSMAEGLATQCNNATTLSEACEFVAVKLARKHVKGFKRYTESDYHADVRESARVQLNKPVFSYPGTCGTCNKQEHACGSSRFYKVTIAIGVH